MRLYNELADWFHLLTAPEEYAEEAEFFANLFVQYAQIPIFRVLELGSGGGSNAFHLKRRFQMTLTDISPSMLSVSRQLNPECEHVVGDMRELQLDRQFDAVFVHDAVGYQVNQADLRAAMETAVRHCRSGGVALFVPDCVTETFLEYQHRGGHDDGSTRSLRYVQTIRDPDPNDTSYLAEFEITLCENGQQWTENEQHTLGLFSTKQWTTWLTSAGTTVHAVKVPAHITGEGPVTWAFLCVKA